MSYADIILPQAGPPFLTYSVGEELAGRLVPGCAVAVPLGVRQIVGGIVLRVHDRTPAFRTKPVLRLLFSQPIVSAAQMRLWEWMAEYYMCTPGEVMAAALPALLKPAGFSEEEFAADEFRARRVRCVALAAAASDEAAFNEVCEKLHKKAPKQYHALVELAGLGGGPVPRGELKADSAALAALLKKGLVVISEREISNYELRITNVSTTEARMSPQSGGAGKADGVNYELPILSVAQQAALDGLRGALRDHNVSLLWGVPSSGKSEVCFHAIAGTLARGRDVLLLLPEIALTTQFVRRVRRAFGDGVVVYHSALSPRQRAETYIRLARSEGGTLVVGVRSAIFLPLPRPGLIVVDEEQDASYKQNDPAPRYNARDAAMVLARESGAKVILASATPSLETWANAQAGKYGMVELTERWGGTMPPEVTISDSRRAAKRGERRGNFNKDLTDRIAEALDRGRQAIVFRNRRGIAPFMECAACGWVPKCGHCNIPLSVHRDSMRCHYCGAAVPLPSLCPACGGNGHSDFTGKPACSSSARSGSGKESGLVVRGFGTEQIEEELARLFPAARIARLDRDSTSSERDFRRIIGDFEAGATDILVGTQMVTKGLDFAGVSVVGVVGADNLMNHPDFRASENAFAMLMQVAGRAGRRQERGQVVIQTVAPDSRLIAQAAAGDYRAMAADMLAERAGVAPRGSRICCVRRSANGCSGRSLRSWKK